MSNRKHGAYKYDPNYHDPWVFSLAIKGATDEEIAEAFGVSKMTIIRWAAKKDAQGKQVLSSFGEARRAGKSQADAQVVKKLYDRCVGYEVKEAQQDIEYDTNGAPRIKGARTISKHVPPDVVAIIYWLNNRSSKTGEWKQKQDIDVSFGDDSIRTAVRELTLDEARAKLAAIRSMREPNE